MSVDLRAAAAAGGRDQRRGAGVRRDATSTGVGVQRQQELLRSSSDRSYVTDLGAGRLKELPQLPLVDLLFSRRRHRVASVSACVKHWFICREIAFFGRTRQNNKRRTRQYTRTFHGCVTEHAVEDCAASQENIITKE